MISFRRRFQRTSAEQRLDLGTLGNGHRLLVPLSAFDRGALVTGPTQTGKTRLMRRVNNEIAEKHPEVSQIIFAPKGNYGPDVRRDQYRAGRRRRTTYMSFRDRRRIPGLNIVRSWGSQELQAKTARDTLLQAMGITNPARDTPTLTRYSYAGFFAVIAAGLTIREAAPLLDYDDEGLREPVIAQLGPGAARQDLLRLERTAAEMRQRPHSVVAALKYFDDLSGSTLNRLRMINENPILRLALGTTNSLDWERQIQPARMTIVDAELGDALDPIDRRYLIMAMITDIWRTCRTRPREGRVRCIVSIDEVGWFPAPVLAEINDQGAEFGLSLIGSHQYLGQFRDHETQDEWLLESFLTDTDLKVCFGKLPWRDAERLAENFYKHDLDPDRRQLVQTSPRQLQRVIAAQSRTRGTHRDVTVGAASAHTVADGESESEGVSSSRGLVATEGATRMAGAGAASGSVVGSSVTEGAMSYGLEAIDSMASHSASTSDAFSRVGSEFSAEGESASLSDIEIETENASRSRSHVEAHTTSKSLAVAKGVAKSVTEGPMVVPTEVFQEPTYQIEGLESQLHRTTAAMVRQPERHALFVRGKEAPIPFEVAEVPDPPFTERQALVIDLDMMNDHQFFNTAAEIEDEIATRRRRLLGVVSTAEVIDPLPSPEQLQRRLDGLPAAPSPAKKEG